MNKSRSVFAVLVLYAIIASCLFERPAKAAHTRPARSLNEMYERLAARRIVQLDRLRKYAAAGKFPQNIHFPGQFVPYFVDHEGTACAVGQLMLDDGWHEVVLSIVEASNHIRIEDAHDHPLLEWIASSGLTQKECALIQPGYPVIEDYRQRREWQDEVNRLRAHFARVEKTLLEDSQQSLAEALRSQIDEEIHRQPTSVALKFPRVVESLRSDKPAVRIGAAYAIGKYNDDVLRSERITALEPNLGDPIPDVRFWTAVALEQVGSASHAGTMAIRRRTVPIFLETFRRGPAELRLPALIQLATTAPESIGTNAQLRLVPEVRRTFVVACEDDDYRVRSFARETLSTWRWHRVACESHRMRRHYLADSYELECLAAEVAATGSEFADEPPAVKRLRNAAVMHDSPSSVFYIPAASYEGSVVVAATEDEAARLVDEGLHRLYKRNGYPDGVGLPFWKLAPAVPDSAGLYFLINQYRNGDNYSTSLLHVVPRPSMLTKATPHPSSWFKTKWLYSKDQPGVTASGLLLPNNDAEVVFGDNARRDVQSFTATCDILASFVAHHSLFVLSREVEQSENELIWSGQFASKHNSCRFFEPGTGYSPKGGSGGWDLHRVTLTCDRKSGQVRLAGRPIDLEVRQLPLSTAEIDWRTKELKFMGWKEFQAVELFATTLVPPEYIEAAEMFLAGDEQGASQLIRRANFRDWSLPSHDVVMAALLDKTGRRDAAKQAMERAAAACKGQPRSLAYIARWELSVGLHERAREHAQEVLQLQSDNPIAKAVLSDLNRSASSG
jgi:hypothetical protein